tara:strand:+ start:5282 stop:5557 length:276 start_codon:yes stop_codon:yes gene_type:complete
VSYLPSNRDYRVHRTDSVNKDQTGNSSDNQREQTGYHGKYTVQKQAKPKQSLSAKAIRIASSMNQWINNTLLLKFLFKRTGKKNFYDNIDS